MTAQELLSEIQDGPLNQTLAPLVATGQDNAVATFLNLRAFRGPVPIIDVSAYCTVNGITGLIEAGAHDQTNEFMIRAACFNALSVLRNDLRLNFADLDSPAFGTLTAALIGVGYLTQPQAAELSALAENRASRAEVVWGQGTVITPSDVALAFGRGPDGAGEPHALGE